MPSLKSVLSALRAHGCDPKKNGVGWDALCPAHDDNKKSLHIERGADTDVVMHCFAGCTYEEVYAAAGLSPRKPRTIRIKRKPSRKTSPTKRRVVANYPYTDEDGNELYRKRRYEPKSFSRSPKDYKGRYVLYALPLVRAAIESGATIYIVEGEKDADRGNDLDEPAVFTTNVEGAGTFRKEYVEQLRGAGRVVVVADKDEPGRKHAWAVADALRTVVGHVEVREAKVGKDLSDHLDARKGLDELVLVERVPAYEWRCLSVLEMLQAKPEPTPWLVKGFIALDELLVLTADPKAGKTWLLYALAISVATGRPVFEKFPTVTPGRVLLVDEEMGAGKIQRRIQRLVRAMKLSKDQLTLLDEKLDIRPQQGLSLGDPDCFDEYRRTLEGGGYCMVGVDSLVGLSQGEENSASDRRAFYNRCIAPFKSALNLAFVVTAHPPVATRTNASLRKRPRGSGDTLAQCDRAIWVDRVSEHRDANDHTLVVALEEIVSREGGGIERQVIRIDGGPEEPVTVRADVSDYEAVVGKVQACQQSILQRVGQESDGRLYQPDLKKWCEEQGYKHYAYHNALRNLQAAGDVTVEAVKDSGRRGKWVILNG